MAEDNNTGLFSGLFGDDSQTNPMDILNNLLDENQIEMKTDLNIKQVKVLVQFYWYGLVMDPDNDKKPIGWFISETMKYYLKLMCSIGRKSRKEIIDGLREMKHDFMRDELMGVPSMIGR